MVRVRLTAAVLLVGLVGFAISCSDTTITPPENASGPAPPNWVHVSKTARSGITLSWEDVTDNEAGYRIERSASGSGGWTVVDSVDANVERFTDATVADSLTYYYRILAYDNVGRLGRESGTVWGKAIDNHTPSAPALPFPPSDSTDIEGPSILLGWLSMDDDPGDTILYDVYFGQSQTGLTKEASEQAGVNHTPAADLALTRSYFWRVVARDDQGATAISPIWNFGTRIEQVDVPAGYFFFGDCGHFLPREAARFCNEENPHHVEAFDIDRFEVSNQLYARFLQSLNDSLKLRVENGVVSHPVRQLVYAEVYPDGDDHSGIEFFPNEGERGLFVPRPGKENHPAVEITWAGAQRYATFMGRKLPTEIQWEKAARGTESTYGDTTFTVISEGDTTEVTVGYGFPYPWGNEMDSHRFNFSQSGDPLESNVGVATTPGGYYDGRTRSGYTTKSNESPFGAFDMAGNVAEWCRDDAQPNADQKVIKGGHWRSTAMACFTFWRQEAGVDSSDNAIGFRTVGTVTTETE